MSENKCLGPLPTMVFLAVCFLTSCTGALLPARGLEGYGAQVLATVSARSDGGLALYAGQFELLPETDRAAI